MKPYVHGNTPTARLIRANTHINYLEHTVSRLSRLKPGHRFMGVSFSSPEFLAEYERERAWAAARWPEGAEVKRARLDAMSIELSQRHRRLAA